MRYPDPALTSIPINKAIKNLDDHDVNAHNREVLGSSEENHQVLIDRITFSMYLEPLPLSFLISAFVDRRIQAGPRYPRIKSPAGPGHKTIVC